MRRFYLQNEIGERKNLQTRGELFFSSPTGMGFANTNAYAQTGGFFTRTSAEHVQGAIAGELVFGGYAEYRALADWIFSGYELQIVYAPANDEYIADIDIVSISKGELVARRVGVPSFNQHENAMVQGECRSHCNCAARI